MKLLKKMGNFLVKILMDSGSTHNLLDPKVVQAIGVPVIINVMMQGKVANGQRIYSEGGSCKEVVSIQGIKFVVPFHVLSLEVVILP